MVDAAAEPEFAFEVKGFRSGLYRFPHYSESPVNSVRLAQNCVITGQGFLKRRVGLENQSSGEFTTGILRALVVEGIPRDRKLHVLTQPAAVKYRQWDGVTWGGTLGADHGSGLLGSAPVKPAWMRKSDGKIALFTARDDGIASVLTEGSGVPADIHVAANESFQAKGTDNPPGHGIIVHFKDRLWVGGGVLLSNIDRHRLYYSNLLDPEVWNATIQNIPISPSGQDITGIAGWRNESLIIGTETQLWGLVVGQSTDLLDWKLEKLSDAIGVGSHYTMISIRDDLFFLDQYGDVRSLKLSLSETSNTLESIPVSFPIRDDIRKLIVHTSLTLMMETVASIAYEGNYLIGDIRASSDGALDGIGNIFLFDTQHQAWTGPMKYFASDAGLVGVEEVFGELTGESKVAVGAQNRREFIALNSLSIDSDVYEVTGNDDASTAIDVEIQTQAYDFSFPNVEKILKWVEIEFDGSDGFEVAGAVDFGSFTILDAVVSVSGSGVRRIKVNCLALERGRTFIIRIKSADAGSTPPIFRKILFAGTVMESRDN